MLQELEGIKHWISGAHISKHSFIAVRAPAVQSRIESAGGVGAVSPVPPKVRVEFRLHQLADAVSEVKSVDDTGELTSEGRAGIAVVFGADEFDVRAGRSEIIRDLLAKIRGVAWPGGGSLEQNRIAVGSRDRHHVRIGVLRVNVINREVGSDAEIFQRREQHGRPAVIRLTGSGVD